MHSQRKGRGHILQENGHILQENEPLFSCACSKPFGVDVCPSGRSHIPQQKVAVLFAWAKRGRC